MPHQTPRQTSLTIGANLRAARDRQGWTQRDVAIRLEGKVSPADVSRWERGKVEPGPIYRQLLAELFFDGDVAALYRNPEEAA